MRVCVNVWTSENKRMREYEPASIGTARVQIQTPCKRWHSSSRNTDTAEYSLFYKALLQKRPITLRSLLIVATPYPCQSCFFPQQCEPNSRSDSMSLSRFSCCNNATTMATLGTVQEEAECSLDISNTGSHNVIGWLIFIGHFPQKSPIISGSRNMTCNVRHPMGWLPLVGSLKL